ncbi:hypothetical protein [Psychrosphaera aestuarii]|uniref:hypothetical protein n=1 Tax=Psychrosphaera aestuarii TaxID=1266052 RepID=UPI001B32C28E|nr:hypothetical protein [Psychrosphaera aestuarii]
MPVPQFIQEIGGAAAFYFSLPIVLFLIVFVALSLPLVSMAYAAIPSLLIETLLSNNVQKI